MHTTPIRRHSVKAQPQLWSDGIHFVRSASKADKHTMRFVVNNHRATASKFIRHATTLQEAMGLAVVATASWIEQHPSDAVHLSDLAEPSGADPLPRPTSAPIMKKQAFATTHFDCIYANPYAQVWQCTSQAGSKAAVGRRKANGHAAEQTPVFHAVGECAVLIGQTPVYNNDGSVRVFDSWIAAEEVAFELYSTAPEEEVISWTRDHVRVGATQHFEIHFNPAINGEKKPFNLYFVEHRRVVYEDRTRPVITAGTDSLFRPSDETDKERQVREDREELYRKLSRVPSYEERTLLFKTIWAADEEAQRREKMLRGESV